MKATFEAFGFTERSDTDEMIGEYVVLHLVQNPIARGPRAGELRNAVARLAPFKEDEWDFDTEVSAPAKKSGRTASRKRDDF